ncbi:hypothetical protein BLNAU_4396 [Blattamonas nauphoetae]|uniref:Ubiquitin-like domain-containing protein n=1 Tax=Blattamonas nauphoetae TaxID=2049346 RepID=A0ABQ9Y9R3_9EUKA|nr:hypothetical protein BLNAU_4396 [Blattamonas nauphoetae]
MDQDGTLPIFVQFGANEPFSLEIEATHTICDVKAILEALTEVPYEEINLYFHMTPLSDDKSLVELGIPPRSILKMRRRRLTQSSQNLPQSAPQVQIPQPQSKPQGYLGDLSLWMTGDAGPQMYDQSMGGMDMMDFMQSDAYRSMIDNPAMQDLLSNPTMIREILASNPITKNMIDSNPQMEEMMRNPETMQMMTDVMMHPSLLNDMMRHADNATRELETLPGGSQMLHSMYHGLSSSMTEGAEQQSAEYNRSIMKDVDENLFVERNETQSISNPWAPKKPKPKTQQPPWGPWQNPHNRRPGGF